MTRTSETWINYAEALAFVGNSLLAPMNQTGTVGLLPEFWQDFPSFDDVRVAEALNACERYATDAQAFADEGGDAVQRASVEYTKLFVGPPRPAAAPWETMYRPGSDSATVGFGQATFEMRALLREAGLEVSNSNNQYADHIGIELLFASELCRRIADAPDHDEGVAQLRAYIDAHPGAWIARLRASVASECPDGYLVGIIALAETLLAAVRTDSPA